ncbi:hypothetical protein N7G274_003249 [Stereocaulon virgatum]|uniref:Uncharacterized protein n=1 Tax=Stereocaulon virgatum TaxID=373712 RepID=A0ABR4ADA3_9LECA
MTERDGVFQIIVLISRVQLPIRRARLMADDREWHDQGSEGHWWKCGRTKAGKKVEGGQFTFSSFFLDIGHSRNEADHLAVNVGVCFPPLLSMNAAIFAVRLLWIEDNSTQQRPKRDNAIREDAILGRWLTMSLLEFATQSKDTAPKKKCHVFEGNKSVNARVEM